MTKNTNQNWTTVRNFIKTTTLEGLETIMVAIQNAAPRFSDAENEQITALVKADQVEKASARLSAAPAGRVTGWPEVEAIITAAPFAEMKKYVHAVDTRIKSLPQNQRDLLFTDLDTQAVNRLLAGLTLPPTGEYLGDDEVDGAYDPCNEGVDGDTGSGNVF